MLPIWGRVMDFVARLLRHPRPHGYEEAEQRIADRDDELRGVVARRLAEQSREVRTEKERQALLKTRERVLEGGEAALLFAMGVMHGGGESDAGDEEGN